MNDYSKAIKENIQSLKNRLPDVSGKDLGDKPNPEKWSKREILGHLVDSAINNLQRFTEASIASGVYKIRQYDQDGLVRANLYQGMETTALLMLLESLNLQICRVVDSFSEIKLKQEIAVYEEVKTLDWLIEDYIDHMRHHLAQV